jgi:hypothetical protein
MRVLYNSSDLHDAIKEVLAAPRNGERRVALVAYLGHLAEAFLPNPRGLEIVCSLEPGATSAEAIERLRTRGAKVFKSDRLHMKVYWSSKRGCVIGSANASGHSLGRGGLKEAGVWIPTGRVRIERLLRYAGPSPITDSELRHLAKASDEIASRSPRLAGRREGRPTFLQWFDMPSRKSWKLAYWTDDNLQTAKVARAESLARYGVREPYDAINSVKGQISRGDWLLCFRLPKGDRLEWMYVDFLVRVPSSDTRVYDRGYPFQAIQVHGPSQYPHPPFRCDPGFRQAFMTAVRKFGREATESLVSLRPPRRFLRLLTDALL